MVERYAHLAPDHLRAGVELLVETYTATRTATGRCGGSAATCKYAREWCPRGDTSDLTMDLGTVTIQGRVALKAA